MHRADAGRTLVREAARPAGVSREDAAATRSSAADRTGREQADGGGRRVPRYVRASSAHSDLTPFVGAVEREQLESDLLAVQDEQQELRAERDGARELSPPTSSRC